MTSGDTVTHERVDHFTMRGTEISVPCAAVFVVREDRIALWRDYFDMNTVIKQMTAVGVGAHA
ncbi:limonene-1,2-epoxide hydrolase family protein [Nocardia sp. CA-135953]|uniref:limonene-1,2-epoxide hydrolase family protein n=1 Tax=Nocardia sp. CA-135953 TaxID=3239978 RepID=UPI003D9881D8